MAAIETVPSYSPSIWVQMCHALPRFDLTMQMRENVFTPDSWEYQQVPFPSLNAELLFATHSFFYFLLYIRCNFHT